MWVPGHGQLGWHLAEKAGLNKRDRTLCALAAMAPDIDGLTFLFGMSNYWNLHHTFGHSIFVIPFYTIGLGLLFGARKVRAAAFCLLGALAHVGVDIFGSMPVYVLWPVYPEWALIDRANPFVIFPVEFLTPFLMIGWSLWVFRKKGISILEIFGGEIEQRLYAVCRKIHGSSGKSQAGPD